MVKIKFLKMFLFACLIVPNTFAGEGIEQEVPEEKVTKNLESEEFAPLFHGSLLINLENEASIAVKLLPKLSENEKIKITQMILNSEEFPYAKKYSFLEVVNDLNTWGIVEEGLLPCLKKLVEHISCDNLVMTNMSPSFLYQVIPSVGFNDLKILRLVQTVGSVEFLPWLGAPQLKQIAIDSPVVQFKALDKTSWPLRALSLCNTKISHPSQFLSSRVDGEKEEMMTCYLGNSERMIPEMVKFKSFISTTPYASEHLYCDPSNPYERPLNISMKVTRRFVENANAYHAREMEKVLAAREAQLQSLMEKRAERMNEE